MSIIPVLYLNQNFSESSRFKICKDVLFTSPVVIYTRKNFFLLDALNEKIELLKSAGLIHFWQLQDVDEKFLNVIESEYLEALTVEHLMGSFYILFMGCLASFTVFIYEIMKVKDRRFAAQNFLRKNFIS